MSGTRAPHYAGPSPRPADPETIAKRRLTSGEGFESVPVRCTKPVFSKALLTFPWVDLMITTSFALVLQGQMYGRASLTCDDASPVFPATRHFSSI